ncbi:MAG: hypothetical protein ACR2QC_06860 [Gammaproteobacteria bacterium]
MNKELSADNKAVNGLWISPDGKPLSNLERLCIYSFCANGHDFHLWSYGDLPNIPADTAPGKVVLRDAAEILPKNEIFFVAGSLAGFSDWFRWELMRQIGGWYVDMDVIALRPFNFTADIIFAEDEEDKFQPETMKWPKGHWFADKMAGAVERPKTLMPWDHRRYLWRKAKRMFFSRRKARSSQGWGELAGPAGMSRALRHYKMTHFGINPYFFYGIPWCRSRQATLPDLHDMGILASLMNSAYSLNLNNSAICGHTLGKNGDFHPNSPFEILKRRYLPELQ